MVSGVGGRVVQDLPGLDRGPLVSLDPDGDEPHGGKDGAGGKSQLVSLVKLRLGSPVEEGRDILGHLRRGSGGSIVVLDQSIVEDSSHTESSSGEVRVVVKTLSDLNTSRRINVTSQEREDVVDSSVSSLNNEREIRRESTGVSSSGGLIVGVGRRKVIGELSWTLEHLSFVVGSIGVLDILGEGLDLVDGVGDSDQVSPGDSVEGVASGADLSVDDVSSSNGSVIEGVEPSLLVEGDIGSVKTILSDGVGEGSFRKQSLRDSVRVDVETHASSGSERGSGEVETRWGRRSRRSGSESGSWHC